MGIKIQDMPTDNEARRNEKDSLSRRAAKVGLNDTATKEEVVAAESR